MVEMVNGTNFGYSGDTIRKMAAAVEISSAIAIRTNLLRLGHQKGYGEK
jgi:hypothetical protein